MELAKREARNVAAKRNRMTQMRIINPKMLKMNGLTKFEVEAVVPWEPIRRMISVEKHRTPIASVLSARFLLLYQAEIATRVIAKVENVSQTLSGASSAAENCTTPKSSLVTSS
jgi:hypothetical protein